MLTALAAFGTLWLGVAGGGPSARAAEPAAEATAAAEATPVAEATSATEAAPVAEPATPMAARLAAWITSSGDNESLPFVIVDKPGAKVLVYNARGRLVGKAPALLGLAVGDDSAPGIGKRALSAIRPEERTTPAGRFIGRLGPAKGEEGQVLWVDYGDAISLHPVVTTNRKERRLQRLKSSSTTDRRISFGCINVPARFFTNVVRKTFKGTRGVIYVLPDTRPVEEVFPIFALQARVSTASAQN